MATNYRFGLWRSDGWIRLGLAGAIVVVFGTPMLWAMGTFGRDDAALSHAAVFLLAGVLMFLGLGYAVGWALRGFAVKVRETGDDDDGGRRSGGASAGHAPPSARPPQR